MTWQTLCALEDLANKERHFIKEEGGAILLLKRNEKWQAYDGLCPHAKAVLSYADCDETSIECPFHGWRFNLESGRCEFPEGANELKLYETKIEENNLMIHR